MEEEVLGQVCARLVAEHSPRHAFLFCVRAVKKAKRRSQQLRYNDPAEADELRTLGSRLQLAAASILTIARDEATKRPSRGSRRLSVV